MHEKAEQVYCSRLRISDQGYFSSEMMWMVSVMLEPADYNMQQILGLDWHFAEVE